MGKKFIFLCWFVCGVENIAFSQQSIGYITTIEDQIIHMYPEIQKLRWNEKKEYEGQKTRTQSHFSLSNEMVIYYNERGKTETLKQKNIKEIYFDKRRFINLPIENSALKKRKRLHKVIAKNDKFILTQYYSGGTNYLYVFDHDGNIIEGKKPYVSFIYKEKIINKRIELINRYFEDCTALQNQIRSNMSIPITKKNKSELADFLRDCNNIQCF